MEKLFLLALAIGFAGFIPVVHPSGESKLKSLVSIINHTLLYTRWEALFVQFLSRDPVFLT